MPDLKIRKTNVRKDKETTKTIVEVLNKHNIKRAGLFGSFARGKAKKKSDIDILIEPTKDMSLFDIVGLELELKKILGRDVDLLTYKGIHKLLKQRILKEEVRIIGMHQRQLTPLKK